jgi:hypothetical protein
MAKMSLDKAAATEKPEHTLAKRVCEDFEGARTQYKLIFAIDWSGRLDSNQRPLAPHASALPGCATPRHCLFWAFKNHFYFSFFDRLPTG